MGYGLPFVLHRDPPVLEAQHLEFITTYVRLQHARGLDALSCAFTTSLRQCENCQCVRKPWLGVTMAVAEEPFLCSYECYNHRPLRYCTTGVSACTRWKWILSMRPAMCVKKMDLDSAEGMLCRIVKVGSVSEAFPAHLTRC
jgi:hypothetical protein